MKKILTVLLALSMAAELAACGGLLPAPAPAASPSVSSPAPSPSPEPTVDQVIGAMINAAGEPGLTGGPGQDALADELELLYGIPPDQWTDAAIRRAGGARASELTVLRLADTADMDAVQKGLKNYLISRQGDFTGYEPEQAALAADGRVLIHGHWAALVIAKEAYAVSQAFAGCFDGSAVIVVPGAADVTPSSPIAESTAPAPSADASPASSADTSPKPAVTAPPEPSVTAPPEPSAAASPDPSESVFVRVPYVDPEKDDMTIYDTSAILSAWRSGDRAALSDLDRVTLETAEAVLDECVSDGMTDYEKERAVYAWITKNVSYDWDHYDPSVQVSPLSYQPHGALVYHKAVCLGFASAFQLLMDMAGVECITVVGAAFQSREDHAWNMVRLNGEWYCVDTTWDEGALFPILWGYFNVTSDYMAETDHQWDYSAVPEATAGGGGKS